MTGVNENCNEAGREVQVKCQWWRQKHTEIHFIDKTTDTW